ncbi:MAG: hypothetical protein HY918_05960 [Candidatus Doudnabacteria bacterium]|nr:hypothetical protein [Candidatus Doudnabacteria bacterium]
MPICDTIESLRIREPVPVGVLGSLFWSRSYTTGKGSIDDYADFQAFLNQPWTMHYAIPKGGSLAVEIKLPAPLRIGEGFENADIFIDYLMETTERTYTRDWNQQAVVTDLSIPKPLIERLEKLLREWRGERLTIHYCLLPGEGDPLVILVQFSGCLDMPGNPDGALGCIVQHLAEALVS